MNGTAEAFMHGVSTYWHTLRHLKPVQLYGRAWFRLSKPRPDVRVAPPRRAQADVWVQPAQRRTSLSGPQRWCILNETLELDHHGWDDPALDKLTRYHLHYFDDLNAYDAGARSHWHRDLLLRWVRENPPGNGTGWEPYPTSLRIINWIKWALAGNELPAECVHSLAVQTRWLAQRLEFHLLGNHLLTNAKALVFAGLFFGGEEADVWRERGLRILEREVGAQILEDGGHFERSTMYHALALEDLLDLRNIVRTFGGAIEPRWRSAMGHWERDVGSMQKFLVAMCHPDGEIAQFNDAAIGIAPSPLELANYAMRLGFSDRGPCSECVQTFSNSGYVRVDRDAAVALLDVGPVGPDHLPAHAHADTLSFELSLFGKRVVVNSGTSCYGNSLERLRQRGTAAHNTVVVDGEDSSEVWSGFRVARRARPLGFELQRDSSSIRVRCAHDGYRRLRHKTTHLREWVFRDFELVVEDRLSGQFERAQARFHLHPSVVLDVAAPKGNSNTVRLILPGQQIVEFAVTGGALRADTSTWHPEFGTTQPNVCLVADFSGPVMRTRISWKSAH